MSHCIPHQLTKLRPHLKSKQRADLFDDDPENKMAVLNDARENRNDQHHSSSFLFIEMQRGWPHGPTELNLEYIHFSLCSFSSPALFYISDFYASVVGYPVKLSWGRFLSGSSCASQLHLFSLLACFSKCFWSAANCH